jgi:uncharacterized membrane protein
MSRKPRKRSAPKPGVAVAMEARRAALPVAASNPTIAPDEPPSRRISAIDALRGTAICMMIVYHGAFDLNWFRIIRADFNRDLFWLASRDMIVTSFLLLVGISLVLARRAGIARSQFWRRIVLVGACAILVTVGSYAAFPKTFITFGILHCIVVASILGWPMTRYPRAATILGMVVIAVGAAIGVALFDLPWLNWIGLMTHRPATEDYVPLLPWFGVVLVGIGIGNWLARLRLPAMQRLSRASPRWLVWLGRHSLLVYMVHQPIMIGLLRVFYG